MNRQELKTLLRCLRVSESHWDEYGFYACYQDGCDAVGDYDSYGRLRVDKEPDKDLLGRARKHSDKCDWLNSMRIVLRELRKIHK